MAGYDIECVIEVGAIRDHELDLVPIAKMLEIRPEIALRLAASRTFDIENLYRSGIENAGIETAASLDKDGMALITEPRDKLATVALLDKGLAPCDFDEVAVHAFDPPHNLINAHVAAACKSVFAVAPYAAQIAKRQPDKGARQAGKRGFTLDRMKDLGNPHELAEPSGPSKKLLARRCGTLKSKIDRRLAAVMSLVLECRIDD